MDNKKQEDIDLCKALIHKVPHRWLLDKLLKYYGISGDLVKWRAMDIVTMYPVSYLLSLIFHKEIPLMYLSVIFY